MSRRMLAGGITAAVVTALVVALVTVLMAGRDTQSAAALQETPAPVVSEIPSPALAPAPSPTAPPKPKPTPQAPQIGTQSGSLEDYAADRETPVGLSVGSIGIADAPIDPVGIEPDKKMEIPVDVSRIGWYEYGPTPGAEEGSAVLTAHIDSREQGRGVFYDLDELDAGDTVDVTMSDGSIRQFVVDEIRQIPKVELPTGDIFRRDGEARLALITCGGEFDTSSRHYKDNIVVFASPVA